MANEINLEATMVFEAPLQWCSTGTKGVLIQSWIGLSFVLSCQAAAGQDN